MYKVNTNSTRISLHTYIHTYIQPEINQIPNSIQPLVSISGCRHSTREREETSKAKTKDQRSNPKKQKKKKKNGQRFAGENATMRHSFSSRLVSFRECQNPTSKHLARFCGRKDKGITRTRINVPSTLYFRWR